MRRKQIGRDLGARGGFVYANGFMTNEIDLAEGKASPAQDILSRMLSTSDDNGKFVHEADVADHILGMIVAGHDSSSSVCTSIVKYLAELPEIYQVVYQEQVGIAKSKAPGELLNWDDIQKMKYSWNVACEVMRLAPPNIGAFREAIADFMYDGFSIQKGSKVGKLIPDEKVFYVPLPSSEKGLPIRLFPHEA
ncbi:hypothetical protein C3L33_18778, partial [Rhododendron williamsianum]